MKPSEVADKLGVDRKTIIRYIAKGLLPAVRENDGFEISIVDFQTLQARKKARRELAEKIKELFILRIYGTPFSHIQEEYGLSPDDVDNGIAMYNFERGMYLGKFGLADISDLLLVEEVTARLKVVDKHIPYELAKLGELKMHTINWSGEERYFPSKHSLAEYLGAAVQTIFYNSREVSGNLGISVEVIDRIANDNHIGRKIKSDSKHSNYLFTPEDVDKLRYGKRRS